MDKKPNEMLAKLGIDTSKNTAYTLPEAMTVGSLIKALQKFDINSSVVTDVLTKVIDVKKTSTNPNIVFIITTAKTIK
jgi:hypothetical protein